MTTKIFKTKKGYETQGEWLDRQTNHFAKLICILMLIGAVVCGVAHIASAMWVNFALDFAMLSLFSVLLGNIGKEVQE